MKVLMCPPEHYTVEYEINPWMHTESAVDVSQAKLQWEHLFNIYSKTLAWQVELIKPQQGLPDMVFTANGGLVIDGVVALPTFRHPERQQETPHFKEWFSNHGIGNHLQPMHDFEGEGDALVWNDIIFAGYPWRTDKAAHSELANFFNRQVVSLQLADARFYHLDTCLTIVDSKTVAIWPKAFTNEALDIITKHVPNVILASDEDALAYGLNAMSNGESIVLSDRAHGLIETYKQKGLHVLPTPISEFQKSGGGVKCLTLELR